MIGISGRSFNWIGTPSAYGQIQSWHAQQQAANQQFLSDNSGIADSFAQTNFGLASGLATIAAKVAAKRVQDQVAAKRAKALAGLNLSV